jgi:hypothetical protein
MRNETRTESTEGSSLLEATKFSELFERINSRQLGPEYEAAYDEAVELAKHLVETKSRSAWNAESFGAECSGRHPGVSGDFIFALKRCIENYHPPVNLPGEPLW